MLRLENQKTRKRLLKSLRAMRNQKLSCYLPFQIQPMNALVGIGDSLAVANKKEGQDKIVALRTLIMTNAF